MSSPKKHHWWPQLQSGYWTGADGFINVIKANGDVFKATPTNIGVEGELYTRFGMAGERDVSIEKWFGKEIESPFADTLRKIVQLKQFSKTPLPANVPKKDIEIYTKLGFVWNGYREYIDHRALDRQSLVRYVSALLVRNPIYLKKLYDFHKENNKHIEASGGKGALKTAALENMLSMFEVYNDRISRSMLILLMVESDKELVFSDSGMTTTEPWTGDHLPFTIHAPLTPKIALEVVPLNIENQPNPKNILVSRINSQGVMRYNRLALSNASQFVFGRNPPPINFITQHFGKQAPAPVAYRVIDGRLETKYDPNLDSPL